MKNRVNKNLFSFLCTVVLGFEHEIRTRDNRATFSG